MTTDADKTQEQMTLELKAMRGKDLAGEYDLSLLKEQSTDDDVGCFNQKWYPVFAVGEPEDLNAGIRRNVVSPWFNEELKAWAWCDDNIGFIQMLFSEGER